MLWWDLDSYVVVDIHMLLLICVLFVWKQKKAVTLFTVCSLDMNAVEIVIVNTVRIPWVVYYCNMLALFYIMDCKG